MLLPVTVYFEEEYGLGKGLADFLASVFISLLQIHRKIEHTASVSDRNGNVHIAVALSLINLLDYREGTLADAFEPAGIGGFHILEKCLRKFLCGGLVEELLIEIHIHRKTAHYFLHKISINHIRSTFRKNLCGVLHHIVYVDFNSLTRQGIASLAVYDLPLGIHHVVILEGSLTHSEMVLLHLLLGFLDCIGKHRRLKCLIFLHTQTVHNLSNPLGTEKTHQIVFQ